MSTFSHLPPSLFIGVFIILLVAFLIRRKPDGAEQWPFQKRQVISESEQTVYWRLLKVAPEFIVLAQVALSSLVSVKRGAQRRKSHFNKFAQKSADFVLCRKDGSVFAVIEIDDKTHSLVKRAEADRTKDKILEAAGIPILRWSASPLPTEEAMRADIAALTMTQDLRVTPDDRLSRG